MNEILAPEQKQEVVTASPSDETSLMNLIVKMAADPSINLDRLERMMTMRDNLKAAEAKRLYNADFVQMKPHLPKIIKLHKNDHTKSTFAKLEDINTQIDPILSKFGMGTSSKVIRQTKDDVTMELQVIHRDGHVEKMELTMPIDDAGSGGKVNKTELQGIASTMTQIKKIGFCAMLNISTGDDKDGNREVGNVTIEQAAEIDTRIRALGDSYRQRFLKWAGVEQTTNISADDYRKCINAIAQAEAQAKEIAAKRVKE